MIDKSKFLANSDDPRYYLREPMQIGDNIVRSNGHIILIEPGHTATPCPSKTIQIEKILDLIARAVFIKPSWPPLPEKQACTECSGSGKLTWVECPECDGDGYVTLENAYSTYQPDCATCGGRKRVRSKHDATGTCTVCAGSGKTWPINSHVIVNGILIKPEYAELIMNEPEIEIFCDPIMNSIAFKHGELTGAIMGMRR